MPGARSYCFTINNDTYEDLLEIFSLDFKYLILGFETGRKGTRHIQGYVQFWDPKTFMYIKLTLYNAHIEVAKGTPNQNITYCSKDGVWFDYGVKPTEGGRLTYEQIEDAFNNPHDNMTIVRQYGRAYELVRQLDIAQAKIKTSYYVIIPVMDALSEIIEYLGRRDYLVVSAVNDLAAYDDVDFSQKSVILLHPLLDSLIPLYPRGIPIKYKYGFQYHTCKPRDFIVVSDQFVLDRLTGYKRI